VSHMPVSMPNPYRELAAVTREFALHVLAYNLARAVGVLKAVDSLLFVLCAALRGKKVLRQPLYGKHQAAETGQPNVNA